jgi:transposase
LDVVQGRSGTVLGGWLVSRDEDWRAGIVTASLDPFRGYATALSNHLPAAVRVLDPFHLVKLALLGVDRVRRRVQQDTLGHRGLSNDPLYRARRILRRRHDRLTDRQSARLRAALTAGDPNDEVSAAWLFAQRLMHAYANPDRAAGKSAAERVIIMAKTFPVPEIARLGRTLTVWRTEFLARFDHPDVSNGPTENLNLKVKNTNASPDPGPVNRQRLPLLQQLPSATTSQPRNHPPRSTNDTDQNPPTQLGCVESANHHR